MDCPICYDAIGPQTGIVTTSCGHSFHFSCLSKWYMQHDRGTCPSCRKEVLPIEDLPIETIDDIEDGLEVELSVEGDEQQEEPDDDPPLTSPYATRVSWLKYDGTWTETIDNPEEVSPVSIRVDENWLEDDVASRAAIKFQSAWRDFKKRVLKGHWYMNPPYLLS